MTTVYGIYVIQLGRECWLAELTEALTAELEAVGLHRDIELEIAEDPISDDVPSVGVFLGSSNAAVDLGIGRLVDEALRTGTVIIPVVSDLAEFSVCVPDTLATFNGFEWNGGDAARQLARALLEELGIEDRQRRVFISHRRGDGLGAAEQAHDALTHRGFTPFIDRFSIRKGVRVQDTIADALEDHAFLLLLETPDAHKSCWVYDEIEYALSHTMGILIVSWPGEVKPVHASDGLPRWKLQDSDLEKDPHNYDILTADALEVLLAKVEVTHAHGIVRRRRNLITSVEEAALASGGTPVPHRAWRVLVQHGASSTLVGVTPRLPRAEDLQQLDEARGAQDGDPPALLVHGARILREPLKEHLVWVAGERELTLTPENAVGGHWL